MKQEFFRLFKYFYIFVAVFFSVGIFNKAFAADLRYGRILDYSIDQVLVNYKEVEKQENYLCSLKDFSCVEEKSKSNFEPVEIPQNTKYYLSADNLFVVLEQAKEDGNYTTALYKNVDGKLELQKNLLLKNGFKRALWSADDKRILFLTRRNNLVLYDIAKDKLISEIPFKEDYYARLTLSPKGNFLAYYIPATTSKNTRSFVVIDLAKAKIYKSESKIDYWDLLSEELTVFAFSPDDKKLVYLDDRKNYPTLYQVNLMSLSNKALAGTRIIQKEYSISDFIYLDANTIAFSANRESPLQWSLYSYNLKNFSLTKISDNVSYGDNFIKIGNKLVFLKIENGNINPVFYDFEKKILNNLSIAKIGNLNKKGEVVKIGNIYGVLLKPEVPSKKLLIWLHGGPYRQTSLEIHPYLSYGVYDDVLYDAQSAGANILKLDYSGSYGYGRTFAEKIKLNVGKTDVADVVSAYNYAKKNLGINETYLIGNSYGGYLALKALVENPEKFQGAFSINGVTDWQILTDRLATSIFNVQFGGLFSTKNQKLYAQADIISKIGNLKNNKIVIAYGTADETIPSDQAGLLYEDLIEKGKNAELVAYKDEGHVLEKKETLADLTERVKKFIGLK